MNVFFDVFGYEHAYLIKVKARAQNQIGWGSFSS